MRRKVLLQLVVPLLSLCVLFLLVTTEPADAADKEELVELSVIFREDSPVWSTTRTGMEQAAADLGAELRFLAPAEANDAAEQQELLARELDSGAEGVILVPADRSSLEELIDKTGSVIITLETDLTDCDADAYIGMDNQAAGEALGRSVLNGVPEDGLVLLLDTVPGDNGIRERMRVARSVLEQEGRKVQLLCAESGSSAEKLLISRIRRTWPSAVVSFEASALEMTSEVLQTLRKDVPYRAEKLPLLYGVGNTPAIAAGLEQSRILAVQAQDDFSAGYLSVVTAINTMRYHFPHAPEHLPFTLVRKETMYDIDRQKLLFPVAH